MRQPVLAPDGHTVALVTDSPNPEESNVVLQFFDTETGEFTRADVPDNGVARPPGPGLAPDGEVPAVRAQRP